MRNKSRHRVEIGDGLGLIRCPGEVSPHPVNKRLVIRAGRLVLQRLDFPGTVPKLDIVVVNELLSGLLRGLIIRAVEINCLHNASVRRENISAILCHEAPNAGDLQIVRPPGHRQKSNYCGWCFFSGFSSPFNQPCVSVLFSGSGVSQSMQRRTLWRSPLTSMSFIIWWHFGQTGGAD